MTTKSWLARRICRVLPPSLSYRLHFTVFDDLLGQPLLFRERVLFGKGSLDGTFAEVEDAYFALHGTMNYAGMTIAAALVKPGDTVFELGANRGTETVSLANLVGSSGRIVAVEADPKTVEVLRSRTAVRSEVIIVKKAVAHTAGLMSWTRNDQVPGSSFLSPTGEGTGTVETTTVDDLAHEWGAPAFVFMDIEGSELFSLQGAAYTLLTARPAIFTEANGAHLRRSGVSAGQLWELAVSSGYVVFDAQHRSFPAVRQESANDATATDWLLLPRERANESVRLRFLLRRARFLPRIAGLNPLDERR